jgi:excisionase family DNA binding protein
MSSANLITIKELSQRLSIPTGTLYNWCYQRRIPFHKAGRSLRFIYEEVFAALRHVNMGSAGRR